MELPARTESVATNLRCNQSCLYCTSRSPHDDPAFIRATAVDARVDAALARGVREIIFTGGEPAMRGDLAARIAHARAAGAERVALETNATLVDEARAVALRDAGLDVARVNLVGGTDDVDAVTRDPGGFGRTLAGLDALARAGIAVEVLAAVTRSTLSRLPALPARVAPHGVRLIEVGVPTRAPDPGELASYEEAVEAILTLEGAARAAEVALRMSPGHGMPPCVFPPRTRSRTAHLYTLTPGAPRRAGHTQLAACAECLVRDRCSGVPDEYLARRAPPPMNPVREVRVRRRLSLLSSVEAQIAHELVTRSLSADGDGNAVYEEIIRVNFQCNQACSFCFVSTHLPAAAHDVVQEAIRAAGARGSRIVLSGGEPTLNPRLVEYVRLARAVSVREVVLQTNAVRLDDARLVDALVDAGVGEAFVSLHSTRTDVSDAITEAPGTFERTVVGIDNLARTPARLTLNFVICEANKGELPAFVRFVAARWPRTSVNVSFVAASTDLVPRDRSLMPRYSDVLPVIAEAMGEAERLGVPMLGFESMCGVPLCLVPAPLERLALVEIPPGFDRGEFLKAEPCKGCRYETTCFGVRRGYAELYGTSELRTMSR
jgi:MoaA/NifB/PqqE/SkfB family radical SAM enzyme